MKAIDRGRAVQRLQRLGGAKGANRRRLAAVVAVATVLFAAFLAYQPLDHRRDRTREQLIDVLYLSELVHEQDAAAWRAVAEHSIGSRAASTPLADEREVDDRMAYLGRLGFPLARRGPIAAALTRLEGDLHDLYAAGNTSVRDRVSGDVLGADALLYADAEQLNHSLARYDQLIDAGSSVALVLPAAGLTLWWIGRTALVRKRGR